MGQDGLEQYDYGFRFYDPAIARWNVIDPMAENHYDTNPYHYVLNNPMLYMDYMGLDTTYNGGSLKEVKITGPAKGKGSGNSYYGYGSGWGDYDPFDTDNGYGGSGDFGGFSMTFIPPPPPVLSSSAAPNKALDNRGNVTAHNSIKDAINWAATGLMTAGAGLEAAGESRVASLFQQGVRGGVSGNYTLTGRNLSLFGNAAMTSSSAPTSLLTSIGKKIGIGATVISGTVLVYEGIQVTQGQMDGGRFGYHAGSFGASFGFGWFAGGTAGAAVGLATTGGEMAYDVFKRAIMTINGQFQNLINIQR